MAAPSEKVCCACLSTIKGRNYRVLTSSTSLYQYRDILSRLDISLSGVCCNFCVNKLNRLKKYDEDETSYLQKIHLEKEKLLDAFKELPGVSQLRTKTATPRVQNLSTKRPLKSPSGVTPKSKKSLFCTPQKITTPKRPCFSQSQCRPQMVDACTQTKTFTTSTTSRKKFDVKVTVNYNGKERCKIITDTIEQSAFKALVNRKGPEAVMKQLAKSENYKVSMIKCVNKDIIKETCSITKKSETDFKVSSTNDLLEFNWKDQYELIEQKLPTLSLILKCLQKKNKSMARYVVAVSVLLYARSQLLNLMQFVLGLVLDSCGLNKEGLNIMHDLGLAVSYTSVHSKRRELVKKQEENINSVVKRFVDEKCESIDNLQIEVDNTDFQQEQTNVSTELSSSDIPLKPIEILGDNLDITIAPTHMTLERQRKSLHWFLTMVKQRRVTYDDINVPAPVPEQQPILEIPPSSWVPSEAHMNSLKKDLSFHISQTLLKYIEFLQPVKGAYPKYIDHPFTDLTKQKSVILNCDLIDSSENSSQGMINIMQKVHELAVPHVDGKVVQKLVFGGDVLTNERAFSAQQAMQNNNTEYNCLFGIVHRPEGLHREFNFLLVYIE